MSNKRKLWIGIAVAAVVVIAAAVIVPLVLARGDDEVVASTSTSLSDSSSTTATTGEVTTSSSPSTSAPTTTAPAPAGLPGDSPGEWVEIDIAGAPAEVAAVALSDGVLLMQTPADAGADAGNSLYAYTFDSGRLVELPVQGPALSWPDIQGTMAVWWEGVYDESGSSFREQHLYSYDLATDTRNEIVTGAENIGHPQVSETWITWTEGGPWDTNPEEYWLMPIHGVLRASSADPVELTTSPVAAVIGDATWSYGLSEDFLVWEQAAPEDGLGRGIYAIELANLPGEPRQIAAEAWRPSLYGDNLLYWQDGVRFIDLRTEETGLIDASGDFPEAAPTYAAYFRTAQGTDEGGYEIVARGLTGSYEQVLSTQADAPWLSTPLAASQTRVALVADRTLHVFEWRGR